MIYAITKIIRKRARFLKQCNNAQSTRANRATNIISKIVRVHKKLF